MFDDDLYNDVAPSFDVCYITQPANDYRIVSVSVEIPFSHAVVHLFYFAQFCSFFLFIFGWVRFIIFFFFCALRTHHDFSVNHDRFNQSRLWMIWRNCCSLSDWHWITKRFVVEVCLRLWDRKQNDSSYWRKTLQKIVSIVGWFGL